jgi:hypothetical protein
MIATIAELFLQRSCGHMETSLGRAYCSVAECLLLARELKFKTKKKKQQQQQKSYTAKPLSLTCNS